MSHPYNPSRDGHLTLHDRDGQGRNPVEMTVHDEVDAVTISLGINRRQVAVTLDITLDVDAVTALQERLAAIRATRGW